jgi:hypothetical protein
LASTRQCKHDDRQQAKVEHSYPAEHILEADMRLLLNRGSEKIIRAKGS